MKSRRMYTLKITRDEFERKPRISYTEIHKIVRKFAGVKMRDTTRRYIQWGFDNGIIAPPRPVLKYYTNLHQHIQFIEGDGTEFENVIREKDDIRYACALAGSSERIMLTSFSPKNGDDLYYQAFTKAHGYDKKEKRNLKMLEFSPKAKPRALDVSSSVLEWDEIDWRIFGLLSPDMRMKYSDIGKCIGLGWRPVKARVENNVMPSCHTATYLFPHGQQNYQQFYLQFKTEFRGNFLRKLDYMKTTTYFLAFGKNTIGIFMFPRNMNNVLIVFKKLEKEGIIQDLRYFMPLAWYHAAESCWPGASSCPSATTGPVST
jgi:hypothetical protein